MWWRVIFVVVDLWGVTLYYVTGSPPIVVDPRSRCSMYHTKYQRQDVAQQAVWELRLPFVVDAIRIYVQQVADRPIATTIMNEP